MISAVKAVIWVNDETREVIVKPHAWGCPENHASSGAKRGGTTPLALRTPSGAKHRTRKEIHLMLETAIS